MSNEELAAQRAESDRLERLADSRRAALLRAVPAQAKSTVDMYSELSAALGCDQMESHDARIARAKRARRELSTSLAAFSSAENAFKVEHNIGVLPQLMESKE